MTEKPSPTDQLSLFGSADVKRVGIPESDFLSIFVDGRIELLQMYVNTFYGRTIAVYCDNAPHSITVVVTGTNKKRLTRLDYTERSAGLEIHKDIHPFPPSAPVCETGWFSRQP